MMPWFVMLVLIALVAALVWPVVKDQKRKADQTRAISNLRQLGFAMYEFETAYGRFPDSVSAPMVKAKSKLRLDLSGHSANAYFRQLIAAELAQSESFFFAPTRFSHKPDNRFDGNGNALSPGEVGFGYLMNGGTAFNTKGNPARPLACAPLAFDGETVSDRKFDAKLYRGKGVILRIDNSVSSLPIHPQTGEVMFDNGKSLLDTGPDTVWGDGISPTIATPLPKL